MAGIGSLEHAEAQDAADALSHLRARFHLPPDRIYLDGNSLGLCSRDAEAALLRALDEWKRLGIEGWDRGAPAWFGMAEEAAALTAPLIGAKADEVAIANSTTVNLHQMLATLYQPEKGRRRILRDALAFPTDAYAIDSHVRLRGGDPARDVIVVGDRERDVRIDVEAVEAAMTGEVALAVLPGVQFTSGQLLPMERLTRVAHERGIRIGWDLSHSVGAVEHRMDAWGCDFAVWCGYKYLNGGPGAPAGLYLNRRHFALEPGMAGWFGSEKGVQFRMEARLQRAAGAAGLQLGTPDVLSLAPLLGALRVFGEVGIGPLRERSLRLTGYLMDLVRETIPAKHGLGFANPLDPKERGGHVALTVPDPDDAYRVSRALREKGVIPDFRRPNILRLAPMALYTTFRECHEAVAILRGILDDPDSYRRIPLGSGVA